MLEIANTHFRGSTPMKKIISFGKVDYNHNGRRDCEVTIEMELRETPKGMEFSASGNIWNPRHTDIYSGGQNLDTIAHYIHSPLFKEIYRLWKLYHLNGMHAGTAEQEQALKEYHTRTHTNYDYTSDCEYLKSLNLYEVEHEGKPYKYGHAWLYWGIPEGDMNSIKAIMQ